MKKVERQDGVHDRTWYLQNGQLMRRELQVSGMNIEQYHAESLEDLLKLFLYETGC